MAASSFVELTEELHRDQTAPCAHIPTRSDEQDNKHVLLKS